MTGTAERPHLDAHRTKSDAGTVAVCQIRDFDRTPRALHFAACGCTKLKSSLSELQWVSVYMLDEPCHVGRPLSSTSVQLSLSANPLGRLPRKQQRAAPSQRVRGSTVDPRVCEHGCALLSSCTSFWEASADHWKPQGTSAGSPASLGCRVHPGDNPLVWAGKSNR